MVKPAPLGVVFFGTPAFAVPAFDALLASDHPVVGVVTRPDRPRGRGQRTIASAVKSRALEAGVPIFQPETLTAPDFLTALAALRADLGVVAAYGRILPETVLTTPRLGMINVHASLLPRYRGAAPVHRAILAGETETGVTIMRVVKALDAGPMLAAARRRIGPDETSVEVEHDLARMGAALLVSTVDRLAAGTASETPQDEAGATYAHRLTKEDGLIDWSRTAAEIHNQVRGLHPWPHAYTFLNGQRLIVLRSRASHRAPDGPEGPDDTTREPGTIVAARGDDLRVAAGSGTLEILELQAEGRRPMATREFLAGHRLEVNDLFTGAPSNR